LKDHDCLREQIGISSKWVMYLFQKVGA
jgi:hypothetical protein